MTLKKYSSTIPNPVSQQGFLSKLRQAIVLNRKCLSKICSQIDKLHKNKQCLKYRIEFCYFNTVLKKINTFVHMIKNSC